MSRPDATASAALDAQVIKPVFFAYLDIVGDPLRACTAGKSITFAAGATGDTDLDGYTFDGISPTVVDIGPVHQKDGGSDTVSAKLSGLIGLDTALLDIIGDKANWQGRTARLWRIIRNASNVQQGAIQHYYTGWMTGLTIGGDPSSQTIELSIESYLVAYTQPSNRTYLDQDSFDPGDLSAKAAIAIANGVSGSPLTSNTSSAGVGGGGSSGCPAEETPILLANEERTAPGAEVSAGALERLVNSGTPVWVWSRHQVTGLWGAWPVLAARRFRAPVVRARKRALPRALAGVAVRDLRATADHPIGKPNWSPWRPLGEIGRRDGNAWVIALTIGDAATYVAAGVLSHNKFANPRLQKLQ